MVKDANCAVGRGSYCGRHRSIRYPAEHNRAGGGKAIGSRGNHLIVAGVGESCAGSEEDIRIAIVVADVCAVLLPLVTHRRLTLSCGEGTQKQRVAYEVRARNWLICNNWGNCICCPNVCGGFIPTGRANQIANTAEVV